MFGVLGWQTMAVLNGLAGVSFLNPGKFGPRCAVLGLHEKQGECHQTQEYCGQLRTTCGPLLFGVHDDVLVLFGFLYVHLYA